MSKAESGGIKIRSLNPNSEDEINIVADRMRLTLEEVIGEKTGKEMYSMDWLIDRVKQHLGENNKSKIFLIEGCQGLILGHTIIRLEKDENKEEFGLFSTIYILPEYRQKNLASMLIETGEIWMQERGLKSFKTYTSMTNLKLIELFIKHAYSITERIEDKKMIVIQKTI